MASGALIAVLVGGGAAAVIVIAQRRAAVKKASSDPCAALKGVNDNAYTACEAAAGIYGILDGLINLGQFGKPYDISAEWKGRDDQNKALNGEVAKYSDLGLGCLGWLSNAGGHGSQVPYLNGTVLEFANGCQPFAGAPGWAKCKQGTSSMLAGDGKIDSYLTTDPNNPLGGKAFVAEIGRLMTGVVTTTTDGDGKVTVSGDPATGKFSPYDGCGSLTGPGSSFPAHSVGAALGFYQGKPYACPDAHPVFDGSAFACGQVGSKSTTVDLSKGNPPPGYTWSTAGGTGHWERLRKGQTPIPYPGPSSGGGVTGGVTTLLLGAEAH